MTTAALQDLFLPDDRCFGCGPANPDGLHLKAYERDGTYTAEWTPEDRFEGPEVVEHDDHRARVHVHARVEDDEVASFHGTYVCVDRV